MYDLIGMLIPQALIDFVVETSMWWLIGINVSMMVYIFFFLKIEDDEEKA